MRKLIAVIALAVMALGACGGDDDPDTENASAQSDTTAVANAKGDFGDFCGARAGFNVDQPPTNATDLKSTLETANANLGKAERAAPSEIKADVKIVVDGFKVYYEALKKADFNVQALASNPEALESLQALQDAKFQEASQRINAWVEANCK
jgi:hypothetical protein